MCDKIVIASHNKGKIEEISTLLNDYGIKTQLAEEFGLSAPEEIGKSFEENAFIKAHFVASCVQIPALADDSGLEIAALGGAPGIYTADWAVLPDGRRDYTFAMEKIYRALEEKNPNFKRQENNNRDYNFSARFVCVFCLALPNGQAQYFRGEVQGKIIWPPRGDKGFGLDSIFQPLGYQKSFAEMTKEEKIYGYETEKMSDNQTEDKKNARLSHRARALQKLVETFKMKFS